MGLKSILSGMKEHLKSGLKGKPPSLSDGIKLFKKKKAPAPVNSAPAPMESSGGGDESPAPVARKAMPAPVPKKKNKFLRAIGAK